MNRKTQALLELVKCGGTPNERRIACDKLFIITGRDYSYLLPKEDKYYKEPDNALAVIRPNIFELVKQIRENLPIHEDHQNKGWRGSKGFFIGRDELEEMNHGDYLRLISALEMAIYLAGQGY